MRRLLMSLGLCFISLVATNVRTSEADPYACSNECYAQYESCTIELCGGKCPECVVPYHLCLEACGY